MTKNKQLSFQKKETTIIKGVVILLMVIHHLFGLKNEYFQGNVYWSYIGGFGKICVSVYAFLSGYGLYSSLTSKKQFMPLKRILNLLVRYWICLTIIIIIDIICGNFPFESAEIPILILNYISILNSYNANAWFLFPYFVFILILPIIYFLLNKIKNKILNVIMEILCIVVPLSTSIVSYILFQEVSWLYNTIVYSLVMIIPFFLTGCCFSRYRLFEKIIVISNSSLLNVIMGVLLMVIVFFLRIKVNYAVYGMNMFDLIFAPIFVLSILMICNNIGNRYLSFAFEKLGTMSTNIWLIHYVFCQGSLSKYIFSFNSAWLSLIIAMALCILSSYFIDFVYNLIFKTKKSSVKADDSLEPLKK